MSTAKLKKDVIKYLDVEPLSLTELAAKMGLKEKRVFRLLRSLFESGEVKSVKHLDGSRRYLPCTKNEKVASKEVDEGEEIDIDEEDDDE
jgi:DNA-binding IclR family transcriptional regulator